MLNVKSCKSLCSAVALLHHHQKGKKKTFVGVNGCEQQLLKVSKGTALIMWDAEKNKGKKEAVFCFLGGWLPLPARPKLLCLEWLIYQPLGILGDI